MKNKLIKFGAIAMIMMIFASMLTTTSSAYVAFNSYNYNYYGEAIESPSGYSPAEVLSGRDLGVGKLNNAVDIYVSPQNEIFILDYVGNNNEARLHIFNSDFTYKKTLSTLKANGHDYTMVLPSSLVVDNYGYIYICDTGNKQVLKLDKDQSGKIVQTIGAPDSDLFTGDFKPVKVAIAKNESIYVISSGCLDGIMEFNTKGVFLRYFGAPDVQMTLADFVNLAWRRVYRSLFGKGVDESFVTYVPTEFENMVVDEYGFVYSVIVTESDQNTDQLFKMNFLGSNILDPNAKSTQKVNGTLSATYGDLVRRATKGMGNVFQDLAVDDDGFITLLDTNLKKVFEYDAEGNLTFVYGGDGNQQGFFNSPVACAKLGKKTLVLDRYYGTVTVFDLTDYGKKLHNAVILYDQGLYDEAQGYWEVILKHNANCELAHIGIAKVYYQYGQYDKAIEHFEYANDRKNYQDAYALYRESILSDHFGLIMTSLLILVILWIVWKLFGKMIIEAIKERKQGGGDDGETEIME